MAEELIAFVGSALRVVQRVVRVAEAGCHVVSQQDTFDIGKDDKLLFVCQVGQQAR